MVREHRTEDTEATVGEEEALVWFADSVAESPVRLHSRDPAQGRGSA